ncbi:MAG TPA: EAL domain-containing protein [Candidatus Dormibacteraeota bacterium]
MREEVLEVLLHNRHLLQLLRRRFAFQRGRRGRGPPWRRCRRRPPSQPGCVPRLRPSSSGPAAPRSTERKLVSALMATCQELGLEIVAEGMEQQAHLDFLIERRCDLAQGYLLGRPAAPEEITARPQGS